MTYLKLLLDMKLVDIEDLKLKKSSMNFLQFLASMPSLILAAGNEWVQLQKVLKSVFPVTGKMWLYTDIKKQDWSILHTERLNAVVTNDTLPVPKYRQLPDNYR